MGDGSGHSDGGGVARDARGIESGLIFGGDAAGAVNEAGKGFSEIALGQGEGFVGGEVIAAEGGR